MSERPRPTLQIECISMITRMTSGPGSLELHILIMDQELRAMLWEKCRSALIGTHLRPEDPFLLSQFGNRLG
jgi:hypothetical protein